MASHPETWLTVTPAGLYCRPADAFIDPPRPVARAIVTHGHADHARPGHAEVIATPGTLAIMAARFGAGHAARTRPLPYGETVTLGDAALRLVPAGHVLGSAQVVLEHAGARVVVSGDYKRRPDATCAPFEPVPCDVFVTEATFGLPVYRHPDDAGEVAKLLAAVAAFPERAVVVGVYALGKAQRLIRLLRAAGWDRPIPVHGALAGLCALYEAEGVALGPLVPVAGARARENAALAGEIVLAPPGAVADRWARRLPEPLVALASGWMRVRQRAKQRGVELPLVVSDHADWDELVRTCADVEAPEVWVTHGEEQALLHHLASTGRRGRALALIGREEEAQ